MIALDTNVFVRFLVNTPDGDTDQVRRARELVSAAERRGEEILLTHIVLVETVWVLRKVYRVPKRDVIASFREVIASAGFVIEDPFTVEATLTAWEAEKGDFADHLIRVRARSLGAEAVYTFDGELHGAEGFEEPWARLRRHVRTRKSPGRPTRGPNSSLWATGFPRGVFAAIDVAPSYRSSLS